MEMTKSALDTYWEKAKQTRDKVVLTFVSLVVFCDKSENTSIILLSVIKPKPTHRCYVL